jgi:hypothetical protein
MYCPGYMGETIDPHAHLKGSYKTVINGRETMLSSSETVDRVLLLCGVLRDVPSSTAIKNFRLELSTNIIRVIIPRKGGERVETTGKQTSVRAKRTAHQVL